MLKFTYKLKKKYVQHVPDGTDENGAPKYKEKFTWRKGAQKKIYAVNKDVAHTDIYNRHAGLRHDKPTMMLVDFKESTPKKIKVEK